MFPLVLTYLKLTPTEPVDSFSSNNIATIINNEFVHLYIECNEKLDLSFKGKNKIGVIDYKTIPSIIYWGRHQEIDKKGHFIPKHKELFLNLKAKAIDDKDKLNELMFNRELLKCEAKLLKKEMDETFFKKLYAKICLKLFEKWLPEDFREVDYGEKFLKQITPHWWRSIQKWRYSHNSDPTQDRIVLWIGKTFSDHGTSWGKPVRWLLYINAGITFLIFISITLPDYHKGYLYIFFELFNPLSSLEETVGKNNGIPWILSLTNAFQKLFYLGMSYEILRVFRRYTVK